MVQEANRASDEGVGGNDRVSDVTPTPKKKRAKLVPVQIVGREGVALLVQWADGDDLRRCIIPPEDYNPDGGTVDKASLEAGLPWGIQWEDVEGVPRVVARELRRLGIFTTEDLLAQAHVARAAVIRTLVPPVVQALIEFAKEEDVT
jgi:hypothetical protein